MKILEDSSAYLNSSIVRYFLPNCSHFNSSSSSIIKVHSEKLKLLGDVSFTTNYAIWSRSLHLPTDGVNVDLKNIFLMHFPNLPEEVEKLKRHSRNWLFPIAEVKFVKDRCLLYFEKENIIKYLFNEILIKKLYGKEFKATGKKIILRQLNSISGESLCFHRARLVHNVLENILNVVELPDDDDSSLHVQITSIVAPEIQLTEQNIKNIKCGLVLDPNNKKMTKLTTGEYTEVRSTDMRLMAMHKYGLRVKDDKKFKNLIEKLGRAAVTVDLLEVKHSSPVQIILNGQGSTKGASFILYNSARLETLLRTFEDRVKSGQYPSLPNLDEIDISVLKEDEEWQLLFGFIFTYPHLIKNCLNDLENGNFSTHAIVQYLNGFVAVFSVYYRRVRILMENRTHLLPSIYARIYLVKCVREILNSCLQLLNIEPVQFM